MSSPVSTYAPFVDCPECAGLGILPAKDNYWTPCEHCDGTGRAFPIPEPHFYTRTDVQGKHVLWAMAAFALVLAGFVYVTRAWEWFRP